MSKIYVPHMVTRYSPVKGRVTPVFDFSDALRFGEICLILDENYKSEFVQDTMNKIEKALASVTKDDYFIPTGEPAIIAMCAAVIAKKTGVLNILRWDRIQHKYYMTSSEI